MYAQPLPVINSFTASPSTVNPGIVTNLSWSVANATSVSLDQGVGDVTGTTSIYLGPVVTTTYTLTASSGSTSVTQQVTVTVVDTPPPVVGNGHTYYVSPSGSDSNSGLSAGSPWLTVAKVNSTNLQPGDTVLFQRNGEWRESLDAPSSGTAGNPITFADYGTGAKPKFWGSVVLNNSLFQSAGNGLYTYQMTTPVTAALVNHVFFYTSPTNSAADLVNSWSYNGTTLTINSPNSNPLMDGNVYTAVVRQDIVFSNSQNHLVFRNLVADESAAANQGYAFRIQNSTDVLVDSCEAYRAGTRLQINPGKRQWREIQVNAGEVERISVQQRRQASDAPFRLVTSQTSFSPSDMASIARRSLNGRRVSLYTTNGSKESTPNASHAQG